MSGRTGTVLRKPSADRHGDGDFAEIGTITNIVMGGVSPSKTMSRQESSNTTGMIGCPADQLRLKLGDRIVIDNVKYEVGATEWDHENSITGNAVRGTGPARYWVRLGGRVG